MNNERKKLVGVLENLFNPINNKDYGLYWNVSNNKTKPLANAEELLKYVEKEVPEGSFINRYANLTSDLILENNIYLDFDLTNNDYLKAERSITETILEELSEATIDVDEAENYTVKNNNVILKQIQQKYKKGFTVENGFRNGFNSFIDKLTLAEEGALTRLVRSKEKEDIKGKSKQEIQKYYLDKFEQDYLKTPFKEATTVAKYFNHVGVKTVLNLSGSKGFALRIPITEITFSDVPELKENPENVKLFLVALAELIETKILKVPKRTSSLDYAVFKKGMQRIPTSQHNKTKLYANFITPSTKYLEAIDVLAEEKPSYIPEEVDVEENTKTFIESDIYKATIKVATEEATKTFKSEEANPNYKFNGKHKELLEIISKVYLPSVRNEVGFRIVHLLRRSNFSQEEVEDIFKELHEDIKDYNSTIKGSIVHAYKTEKLVGLRSLIKWLKYNASAEVKIEVINYFKKKFNYYEEPVETVVEDSVTINEKEYNLTEVTTSKKKYYLLNDFEAEGNTLVINKLKAVVFFKQKNKLIAKLDLKQVQGKAVEGLVPSSEYKFNKFKKAVEKKVGLEKTLLAEAFEELDLFFSYLEEVNEQEEQVQEQEEEITKDIEEDSNRFDFGEYVQLNKNPYSDRTGIFYKQPTREGVNLVPVANVIIEDIEIIINPLKLSEKEKEIEPVYNVTYYNGTIKKRMKSNYLTGKELTEEFIKAKVFYHATKENVDSVLNTFIIEGAKEDKITVKEEAYLEGFFIINGKVVENTKLKNLKKYTSEDVYSAISLLNEIMKDRTEEGKANDSTVYRFMLWNPFSFCLKQIGLKTGIYSLILIGKSKANKTGAIKVGNLFYLNTEEETSGSTVSVLGSKLEENSFSSIFDECYNLLNLPETPDVMKKSTQDIITRVTKDRTDNKKSDKFFAFGLPVFLLNERMEFKDYIRERFKITDYTSKSYVPKAKRTAFNEKYLPETPNTILKKVAVIGAEFKKKIVPLIEAEDKRLLKPEELTISILKEIASETSTAVGKPIDFLPEMYNITEASSKYNYDVAKEIVKLLNTEFKQKNRLTANSYYSGLSFTNSAINNDFDFITYNKFRTERTSEKEFIIDSSKLVNYVNDNVEETVELENILEALDLTETLKAKAKANKTSYSKFINKQHKIKVEGTKKGELKNKNITGFYLTVEELANKLFSFNIDFSEKNNN